MRYRLKRARRKGDWRVGDIVPLDHMRTVIELVPAFGKRSEPIPDHATSSTSMKAFKAFFYLNHFCDMEIL